MLQVLVNLTESAYKEMCKNGIDNVDYDIRELMKNGKVINNDRSLCDSCATRGCVLQSGVVRKHCDFYTEEAEPCEDAVSRTELLKIYEDGFVELQKIKHLKDNIGANDRQLGVNWCINTLKELPPVKPTQRWIPVSERLPKEENKSYWICTDGGYQCECRWTNVNHFWTNLTTDWHWHIMDVPQYSKVVAWMPLPEPYKESEEA